MNNLLNQMHNTLHDSIQKNKDDLLTALKQRESPAINDEVKQLLMQLRASQQFAESAPKARIPEQALSIKPANSSGGKVEIDLKPAETGVAKKVIDLRPSDAVKVDVCDSNDDENSVEEFDDSLGQCF